VTSIAPSMPSLTGRVSRYPFLSAISIFAGPYKRKPAPRDKCNCWLLSILAQYRGLLPSPSAATEMKKGRPGAALFPYGVLAQLAIELGHWMPDSNRSRVSS
jgi:hypothetical protein